MEMSLEDAITHAEKIAKIEEQACFLISNEDGDYDNHKKCGKWYRQLAEWLKDYKRLLERDPCEDAISRQEAIRIAEQGQVQGYEWQFKELVKLPPVNQEPKIGHCKDCKYFEYDSVARVDGIPLIVAHEICSKWSDGCKTREDGYCFLFESQESEE